MQILKLSQKKYMDVNQIMSNHTQKHIKNIHAVHMVIKLFVVMITNIQNQSKFIEEKMLHIKSWKRF